MEKRANEDEWKQTMCEYLLPGSNMSLEKAAKRLHTTRKTFTKALHNFQNDKPVFTPYGRPPILTKEAQAELVASAESKTMKKQCVTHSDFENMVNDKRAEGKNRAFHVKTPRSTLYHYRKLLLSDFEHRPTCVNERRCQALAPVGETHGRIPDPQLLEHIGDIFQSSVTGMEEKVLNRQRAVGLKHPAITATRSLENRQKQELIENKKKNEHKKSGLIPPPRTMCCHCDKVPFKPTEKDWNQCHSCEHWWCWRKFCQTRLDKHTMICSAHHATDHK